jgi:hypothetical protein
MEKAEETSREKQRATLMSRNTLLIGIAGSLIAGALWSMVRQQRRSRRYADHGVDRRNPMHFFLAGRPPQRRKIDRSGQHPLFERRQSVYDAY